MDQWPITCCFMNCYLLLVWCVATLGVKTQFISLLPLLAWTFLANSLVPINPLYGWPLPCYVNKSLYVLFLIVSCASFTWSCLLTFLIFYSIKILLYFLLDVWMVFKGIWWYFILSILFFAFSWMDWEWCHLPYHWWAWPILPHIRKGRSPKLTNPLYLELWWYFCISSMFLPLSGANSSSYCCCSYDRCNDYCCPLFYCDCPTHPYGHICPEGKHNVYITKRKWSCK